MRKRYYRWNNEDVKHHAGNRVKVSGVIFQGEGRTLLAMLPQAHSVDNPDYAFFNVGEWTEILERSDDPVYFENNDLARPFHRKAMRAVSGAVQQKIWVRDGLGCMYCNRPIGEVQLTVDHFVPLELGGDDHQGNYLTACRACNKKKGSIEPEAFCREHGYDYEGLMAYLHKGLPRNFVMHLR